MATDKAGTAVASLGPSSGRFYWEVVPQAGTGFMLSSLQVGVMAAGASLDASLGGATAPGAAFSPDGTLQASPSLNPTYVCGAQRGDVVGVALDLDAQKMYFSVNGLWGGGSDPEQGLGGVPFALSASRVYPAVRLQPGQTALANFGQRPYAFPPPTGFETLHP